MDDPSRLLELQIEALFTHGPDGRIRRTNELLSRPAPRFFLGRTAAGPVWRVGPGVDEATGRALVELAATEPPFTGDDESVTPLHLRAYRRLLDPVTELHEGPAFAFPPTLPPAPASVVVLDATNIDVLLPFGFTPEELAAGLASAQPFLAILEDGVARSMCHCARFTARAAEAGVTTLPAFEGRGLAGHVVAAWAIAIRATGRVPLYSTSWTNLRSRAVARRLGLVAYGTDLDVW